MTYNTKTRGTIQTNGPVGSTSGTSNPVNGNDLPFGITFLRGHALADLTPKPQTLKTSLLQENIPPQPPNSFGARQQPISGDAHIIFYEEHDTNKSPETHMVFLWRARHQQISGDAHRISMENTTTTKLRRCTSYFYGEHNNNKSPETHIVFLRRARHQLISEDSSYFVFSTESTTKTNLRRCTVFSTRQDTSHLVLLPPLPCLVPPPLPAAYHIRPEHMVQIRRHKAIVQLAQTHRYTATLVLHAAVKHRAALHGRSEVRGSPYTVAVQLSSRQHKTNTHTHARTHKKGGGGAGRKKTSERDKKKKNAMDIA